MTSQLTALEYLKAHDTATLSALTDALLDVPAALAQDTSKVQRLAMTFGPLTLAEHLGKFSPIVWGLYFT